MTEQLQAKMQIIDNMTADELKAMTIFNFDEFASEISHAEARRLLVHFFDRMGRTFKKLPSVDFGDADIEEISRDFNVLEVTTERLFEDTIPDLKKRCSEIPCGIEREANAYQDICYTFSEKIRTELDSYLED